MASTTSSSQPASGPRGSLIVFEGLDRSGKTTQCTRLQKFLRDQGQPVCAIRFPNRSTVIGQMINAYLTGSSQQEDHAIHLLFSANRWEAAEDIKAQLAAGTTVIIDRYYYSGCVYSAAKNKPAMDLAWCRHMEVGLPRPDLCLFLDLAPEEAARRGGYGTERYETEAMQNRVRELFEEMRTHEAEKEDIVRIDASGPLEQVWNTILQVVEERLGGKKDEPRPLRYITPW